MSFSVVIPSHHRVDLLHACLRSVTRFAPVGTEIIVIDDGSPDAVISQVVQQFHAVRVIRLEQQHGFCVAANLGMSHAQRPIVQLLNDDTEVCPNWAQTVLPHFDDPQVAAVAPLVLKFPTSADSPLIIDSAGDDYFIGGVARKRFHGQLLTDARLRRQRVFGASGASAFYRRSAFEQVGGFPETFGAYFEDVDLSFRLNRAGHRIVFDPDSHVYHHVSASYGAKLSPELARQQSRNEERVFWRNVPRCGWWSALPLHVMVLLAKGARRAIRGELQPFLLGRLDALREWREIRNHRSDLSRRTG